MTTVAKGCATANPSPERAQDDFSWRAATVASPINANNNSSRFMAAEPNGHEPGGERRGPPPAGDNLRSSELGRVTDLRRWTGIEPVAGRAAGYRPVLFYAV